MIERFNPIAPLNQIRRTFLGQRRLPDARRPGAAPGTLREDSEKKASIEVCRYSADDAPTWATDIELSNIAPTLAPAVQWFNIVGIDDTQTLRQLGGVFGIDDLVLEDIQHANQRPKLETFDALAFAVLPMPDDEGHLEQISIVWGEGFVITFNERPGDCFSEIRKRLESPTSLLRQSGADFLAYALTDAIVDHYAPPLGQLFDSLDSIEEQILQRPAPELLPVVLKLRRDVVRLRRVARPIKQVTLDMQREGTHVTDATRRYIADTVDHATRNLDTIDAQHELAAGLLDLYQGRLAHETNEVTRTLTIVATVFMPLGFIAGVYGMNFNTEHATNMPELAWPYGYFFALGLMASAAIGLLWWMGRRGFFGNRPDVKTSG